MSNLGKLFIEGVYTNLKRVFLASDRNTDMQLRHDVLNGNVKPTEKVDVTACIGCGGCSNVCPTQAISMVPVEPEEIIEGLVKSAVPKIDEMKCVNCYYCHDFCPVYALFGVPGTIHPNDVGDKCDTSKISEDKIKYIAQFLSDNAIIQKTEEQLDKSEG